MKLAAISLALTALAAGTAAQSLSDLPKCAQDCATNAIPQECGLDVKCICSAQSFIASITCCVAKACSPADQDGFAFQPMLWYGWNRADFFIATATIKFADNLCGIAGVTTLPQTAVCTTTATASAASAASGSTSVVATTTASTTASATANSSAPSASSTTASHTSSGSASATTPSGTSAAAPIAQTRNGGVIAGVGAAAVLAAMLLA
ncbi:hypothetical protein T310_3165 [Rasamsonia emersonii CBS 393.64]|uniref:CFEM domain-containing protein n=1 Tax=Rasamsonia emersonii (strain ATCC 16479 / CBS 393.64 / IMI 116815) TaxID=1408163 RepID=A0A0F4YYA2_RASE3|nr:hypothetical protein T310_3165 [Rasamsonia emersonii CBS 393.64]KKA22811.1 hypothetical protein T310_3165 [Rasamsonia emersonii CBS 393.64]